MSPADELTAEPTYDVWLTAEQAKLTLQAIKHWLPSSELHQKMRTVVRHIRLNRAMSSWVRVPHTRTPRRRRVTSGPRKARAPDDGDSSGDVGEPETPSGCSTSPQPFDFLDALALSLGWERAA